MTLITIDLDQHLDLDNDLGHDHVIFLISSGSVKVAFDVLAKGTDIKSVTEMEKSTKSLRDNLATTGLQLTIGGKRLTAQKQKVAVENIDVSKPVEEHRLKFKVIDRRRESIKDKSSESQLMGLAS